MNVYHMNDMTMPVLTNEIIKRADQFYGHILTNKGIRTQKEYAIRFFPNGSWTTLTHTQFNKLNTETKPNHIVLNSKFEQYLTKEEKPKYNKTYEVPTRNEKNIQNEYDELFNEFFSDKTKIKTKKDSIKQQVNMSLDNIIIAINEMTDTLASIYEKLDITVTRLNKLSNYYDKLKKINNEL